MSLNHYYWYDCIIEEDNDTHLNRKSQFIKQRYSITFTLIFHWMDIFTTLIILLCNQS